MGWVREKRPACRDGLLKRGLKQFDSGLQVNLIQKMGFELPVGIDRKIIKNAYAVFT
jgi:hypothetical protein